MSKVIDNLEAHRQERNEEMELLRGQVDEMAELKRNNDLLETHCKTLNDQLEADRNEARQRYIDLITCILQVLHIKQLLDEVLVISIIIKAEVGCFGFC